MRRYHKVGKYLKVISKLTHIIGVIDLKFTKLTKFLMKYTSSFFLIRNTWVN